MSTAPPCEARVRCAWRAAVGRHLETSSAVRRGELLLMEAPLFLRRGLGGGWEILAPPTNQATSAI